MAGLPKSRVLMQSDPYLLEVNRTCTVGTPNVNSMLYGAIARAAKALGYRTLVTYTLTDESGASLRASGWQPDGVKDHDVKGWESRFDAPQRDLFGNERKPIGPKTRWIKRLQTNGTVS
jgi:hypothetical protein